MESTKRPFSDLSETERQRVAEALWNREKPRCQSALVDDLLKAETLDGFGIDDIDGLYVDPSGWDIAECREWLDEHGYNGDNYPDGFDALAESDLPDDYGGVDIEEWREAVTEHAEPAEPYEWWEVGSWLAERLSEAGEVTLCNDYGNWWGRCCTGQSVTLDHVIQRLGAEYCIWALDK